MSEISEHNLYDIDDLVTAWELGWEYLEKYASNQCQYKLSDSGDDTKPPLERIHLIVRDILNPYVGAGKFLNVPKTLPDDEAILNLAATNKTVYKPVKRTSILRAYSLGSWAKDKVKLRKSLQKVSNAFAESDDYEQAFSKIATKENVKIFNDHWSQQNCHWAKGEYLSVEIEKRLKGMMGWLKSGLSSKTKCQEAWWNCLWLFMKPRVETMFEIKEQIYIDSPLSTEQLNYLNYFISHGYPITDFLVEADGKRKIQIILKPHTPQMLLNSPFEVMSVILLVQPAFDLSQKLQSQHPEPTFIATCHAPSCWKSFYTQRKTQVVCGGSKGNIKTKCALEWQRYQYWLRILGKEDDWNVPMRQIEFLTRER